MVTTVSKNAHLGAAILLGIATFLLFLTCITAPVVDQLYLYEVEYRMVTAARPVRVGIWGYCILDLKPTGYAAVPFEPSVQDGCSKASVGFSLDANVAEALHTPQLEGFYNKGHTGLLVMYPIITLLTLFSCLFQTGLHLSHKYKSRYFTISLSSRSVKRCFIYNSFATFLTIFVLVVQLSVTIMMKFKIKNIRLGQEAADRRLFFKWGNTFWLSIIVVILHLADLLILTGMRRARIIEEARISSARCKDRRESDSDQASVREQEQPSDEEKVETRSGSGSLVGPKISSPPSPSTSKPLATTPTPPPSAPIPSSDPPAYTFGLDGYGQR